MQKYSFSGNHFKISEGNIRSFFLAIKLTFSAIVQLYNVFVCTSYSA
jgi:hypothetical protein